MVVGHIAEDRFPRLAPSRPLPRPSLRHHARLCPASAVAGDAILFQDGRYSRIEPPIEAFDGTVDACRALRLLDCGTAAALARRPAGSRTDSVRRATWELPRRRNFVQIYFKHNSVKT